MVTCAKGFNDQRAATFYPCWSNCVDESVSAWQGKDGNYCSDGMPLTANIDGNTFIAHC